MYVILSYFTRNWVYNIWYKSKYSWFGTFKLHRTWFDLHLWMGISKFSETLSFRKDISYIIMDYFSIVEAWKSHSYI